jgi:hypothetical protein
MTWPYGNEQAYTQDAVQRYGTGAFNTALEVEQWDKILHNLFMETDNHFIAYIEKFGGGSLPSDSYKLQWGEYDQEIVALTVAGGAASELTVTGTEYLPLIAGDVLYCASIDRHLLVTATPNTTAVEVKKITSSSITETLDAADYVAGLIYHRVYTQKTDGDYLGGSTKYAGISARRKAADLFNYIGTFEKYTVITEHEKNQPWIYEKNGGLTLEAHELMVKLKTMMNEMEYHAFIGKMVNVAGTTHLAMGSGILNFTNIQSESGSTEWTWKQFTDWVKDSVKAKNKNRRIPVMCNLEAQDWINHLLLNTFNTNISGQADKDEAGMDYYKINAGTAILELYPNHALGELFTDPMFVAIDPTKISRRHIRNMNLQTKYNVQSKDAHVIVHQHYGTQGWEIANAETVSKLTLSDV